MTSAPYTPYILSPESLEYRDLLDQVAPARRTLEWALWEYHRCFAYTLANSVGLCSWPRLSLWEIIEETKAFECIPTISSLHYTRTLAIVYFHREETLEHRKVIRRSFKELSAIEALCLSFGWPLDNKFGLPFEPEFY